MVMDVWLALAAFGLLALVWISLPARPAHKQPAGPGESRRDGVQAVP